jgi:hypothetical protein
MVHGAGLLIIRRSWVRAPPAPPEFTCLKFEYLAGKFRLYRVNARDNVREPMDSSIVPAPFTQVPGSRQSDDARTGCHSRDRNAASPPSWLAMNAPGTVTRISSAWARHAHAEWPAKSASLISACCGQVLPALRISH